MCLRYCYEWELTNPPRRFRRVIFRTFRLPHVSGLVSKPSHVSSIIEYENKHGRNNTIKIFDIRQNTAWYVATVPLNGVPSCRNINYSSDVSTDGTSGLPTEVWIIESMQCALFQGIFTETIKITTRPQENIQTTSTTRNPRFALYFTHCALNFRQLPLHPLLLLLRDGLPVAIKFLAKKAKRQQTETYTQRHTRPMGEGMFLLSPVNFRCTYWLSRSTSANHCNPWSQEYTAVQYPL